MRVRLTKRFADQIDGIDLDGHMPGDVLELSEHDARVLVAEAWAIPERRETVGQAPQHERRTASPDAPVPGRAHGSRPDDESAA